MFDPSEGTRPMITIAQPSKVNNSLPARVLIEPPNIAVMSDTTLAPPCEPIRASTAPDSIAQPMQGALRWIPRGAQAPFAQDRIWRTISHTGTLACAREGWREGGSHIPCYTCCLCHTSMHVVTYYATQAVRATQPGTHLCSVSHMYVCSRTICYASCICHTCRRIICYTSSICPTRRHAVA